MKLKRLQPVTFRVVEGQSNGLLPPTGCLSVCYRQLLSCLSLVSLVSQSNESACRFCAHRYLAVVGRQVGPWAEAFARPPATSPPPPSPACLAPTAAAPISRGIEINTHVRPVIFKCHPACGAKICPAIHFSLSLMFQYDTVIAFYHIFNRFLIVLLLNTLFQTFLI